MASAGHCVDGACTCPNPMRSMFLKSSPAFLLDHSSPALLLEHLRRAAHVCMSFVCRLEDELFVLRPTLWNEKLWEQKLKRKWPKCFFLGDQKLWEQNFNENGPNQFFFLGPKTWSESILWQRFCVGMVSTTSLIYAGEIQK